MSEKFSQLLELMEKLRGEQGCPWDREQTHESLKPFLIEEAYEVLDAIAHGEPGKLKEELGDLLLQIVFHGQISKEQGEFDMDGVISACSAKLIRRHPHVFEGKTVRNAGEVWQRWEELKYKERGRTQEHSVLDSIPRTLPALLQAQRVQERASRVGFDWPDSASESFEPEISEEGISGISGVLSKVREEFEEVREAVDRGERERIAAELGDLFFSLVNLCRFARIDPEDALRRTTHRFIERFNAMQRAAQAQGKMLRELSLAELNTLWEQAKEKER